MESSHSAVPLTGKLNHIPVVVYGESHGRVVMDAKGWWGTLDFSCCPATPMCELLTHVGNTFSFRFPEVLCLKSANWIIASTFCVMSLVILGGSFIISITFDSISHADMLSLKSEKLYVVKTSLVVVPMFLSSSGPWHGLEITAYCNRIII